MGTLHVVDEEFLIDTEVLSTAFDRHLHHFVVLNGTTCTPLSGHRIVARGDTEVQLVDKPIELINAWFLCSPPGEFVGNRKWYKEFRNFAATTPFPIPQMHAIEQAYPPRFCGVAVRELAPLILQVIVCTARPEIGGLLQPTLFRNADGCAHSIVRRTKAPLGLVLQFMREFEAANIWVTNLIYAAVTAHPYENYFS